LQWLLRFPVMAIASGPLVLAISVAAAVYFWNMWKRNCRTSSTCCV